jgi:hypothetical protein
MSFLEWQFHKVEVVAANLLSPGAIFSLPQFAVALGIAFVFLALRQWRRRGALHVRALLRAMTGRRILLHRSTGADAIYFLVNSFVVGGLIGWGIFSASAVSDIAGEFLRAQWGVRVPCDAPLWMLRAGLTLWATISAITSITC